MGIGVFGNAVVFADAQQLSAPMISIENIFEVADAGNVSLTVKINASKTEENLYMVIVTQKLH
jgi:hypothetical protein